MAFYKNNEKTMLILGLVIVYATIHFYLIQHIGWKERSIYQKLISVVALVFIALVFLGIMFE